MEQTRPVAASRLALRDEIREGPDLRLNAVDLSFQLRPEALELSFRFETVHRRPSHFLLGSTDLRPIPGLDLSKSFELPLEFLGTRNRTNPRARVTRFGGTQIKARRRAITTSRTPLV